jgi:hypothetical protein
LYYFGYFCPDVTYLFIKGAAYSGEELGKLFVKNLEYRNTR